MFQVMSYCSQYADEVWSVAIACMDTGAIHMMTTAGCLDQGRANITYDDNSGPPRPGVCKRYIW
jgi:hypothetical protein